MPAPRIKFKDKLLYSNMAPAYPCSNEMLTILGGLVDEAHALKPIKRVGCICSGGEIPLQLFGPRGCKVKAIDYSRESLTWAVAKTMLLQSHTPEKVREILTKVDLFDEPLWLDILAKCSRRGLVVTNNYEKKSYTGTSSARKLGIGKYWEKLTDEQITQIAKASSKIEFIHGDLSKHLVPEGPFDMIYTSNALTFGTINGGYTKIQELVESLTPGGFILSTSNPTYQNSYNKGPGEAPPSLKILKSVPGTTDGSGAYVHWTYFLAQRDEPVKEGSKP